jgi:CHASE domain
MRKKFDLVNYSNDSHGTGSRCSSQKLQLTQAGLCFVLCALIATLGSLAYFETKQSETYLFRSQFRSVALSISESIRGGVARKSIAAGLVSNMYTNGLDESTSRSFPNFTLPGFEASMSQVCGLSGFKFLAYSPLVTNVTRAGWEEYARKNVALLEGPLSLTESVNGSLTVADGISNITDTGKEKHSGYIPQSTHPTWYFPVWQVAPIRLQSHVVMYDPHAFGGSRLTTIDKAIEARESKFTDTIHLVVDGLKIPATILMLPIRRDDEKVIGLISGGFTWAEILQGIVPHGYRVHCVLSTATSKDDSVLTTHIIHMFDCPINYGAINLITTYND